MTPSNFKEPSPLDMLTDFTNRYGRIFRVLQDPDDRYFERDLHSLISAFVNDAVRPWQQALADAAMQTAGPLHFFKKPLEQDGRMPDAAGETSLLQRKEGSIE